jgi:hypothetical protein
MLPAGSGEDFKKNRRLTFGRPRIATPFVETLILEREVVIPYDVPVVAHFVAFVAGAAW